MQILFPKHPRNNSLGRLTTFAKRSKILCLKSERTSCLGSPANDLSQEICSQLRLGRYVDPMELFNRMRASRIQQLYMFNHAEVDFANINQLARHIKWPRNNQQPKNVYDLQSCGSGSVGKVSSFYSSGNERKLCLKVFATDAVIDGPDGAIPEAISLFLLTQGPHKVCDLPVFKCACISTDTSKPSWILREYISGEEELTSREGTLLPSIIEKYYPFLQVMDAKPANKVGPIWIDLSIAPHKSFEGVENERLYPLADADIFRMYKALAKQAPSLQHHLDRHFYKYFEKTTQLT